MKNKMKEKFGIKKGTFEKTKISEKYKNSNNNPKLIEKSKNHWGWTI